ncbi:TetR/AcrR family transcriptional regulator [Microbaculum marinum]|uniref:TetR/AcrR family transcriptional regulator n=1 Tax=Microbaculum marinum TaxID=1764581 RepID=A0AAW9RSI6_9HYPH
MKHASSFAPTAGPCLARRRGYHHGNLREALIEAARQLLAEKGAAGFTLKDAAKLAGVSPAAPYRHFKDRAALIGAVSDRGFELFSDRLRGAAETGADPADAFRKLGEAYLAFAAEEPGYYEAMFDAEAVGASDHDAGAGAFSILVAGLTKAYGEEAFGGADPRVVALNVWALSHGIATLAAAGRLPRGPGVPDPSEILSSGVDALVRGAGRD